jgi:DNA repair protein RadC
MKSQSKGIVAWPEGERPRERLLRLGAQSLTDAELVAILLRVGMQRTSAVELGRQILEKFGSLRALSEAPLTALLDVKGLKSAKAAQLAAAMEVARRVSLPDARERVRLKSTREASDSDRLFTEDLFAALKPIGVRLLDHVIIGEGSVFSFADKRPDGRDRTGGIDPLGCPQWPTFA